MAHLPSYKSFNFHDVEEIERRIFSPMPAKSENALGVCPGTLNFQDEMHHRVLHHQEHSSQWERLQHNLHNIFHHTKIRDPMVMHVNENFSERETEITLVEGSSEDENVPVSSTAQAKPKRKRKKLPRTKNTITSNTPEDLEISENVKSSRSSRLWRCFLCKCQCKSNNE